MESTVEKECATCHVTKPASEFYASKRHAMRLYHHCKRCQIALQAKRSLEKPRRHQSPPGQRYCATCKTEKPLAEFNKDKRQYGGLAVRCRACAAQKMREYQKRNREIVAARAKAWRARNPGATLEYGLKQHYGLPRGSFAKMVAAQNGVCAICGDPPPPGKRLHVDHCHDTNIVRGLLCGRCNIGIGQLRHDTKILQLAVQYLTERSTKG